MEASSSVSHESSAVKSRPQSSRRGVRVVGMIRPFLQSEIVGDLDGDSSRSSSCEHVRVTKSEGDHALISFGDQTPGSNKDCYKLDWCYEKDEGISEVFAHEVKPLLESLRDGTNACVIAYGARGSGKSHLIQGSEENPGLALLSVSDILSSNNQCGVSLSISCYEVCQDHVYDLLEPKEQEVLVLEDAARKIQLKGLSQVPVNSVYDFKKLYNHGISQRRCSHKVANDYFRSHRGLIMYVSFLDKYSDKSFAGKLNFVDLAGCEDAKRSTNSKPNIAEGVKVNKSLYTLLKVVYALNANDSYIPYRESKLTRLLQDSLCRASRAVLITCLNPSLCQDTVHAVNLASRSSQVVNQYQCDMAKITKSNSRFLPSLSLSTGRIHTLGSSLKKREFSPFTSTETKGNGTPFSTKIRVKPPGSSLKKEEANTLTKRVKPPGSSLKKEGAHTLTRKLNDTPSVLKGKKLFNSVSPVTPKLKGNISLRSVPAVESTSEACANLNLKTGECSMMEEGNCEPTDPNYVYSVTSDEDDCDSKFSFESVPIESTYEGDTALNVEIGECSVVEEGNCVHMHIDQNGHSVKPEEDDGHLNKYNCTRDKSLSLEINQKSYIECQDITEQEIQNSLLKEDEPSPPISVKLREISNSLKLFSIQNSSIETPKSDAPCVKNPIQGIIDPKTPAVSFQERLDNDSNYEYISTPQDILNNRSTGIKKSLVQECLAFLNSANKEELKRLRGIGEKRATYVLQKREQSPEPFKDLDDLKDLGLTSKQINSVMSSFLGEF